uniref:Uncharacterized protein n=1 Tax=viral metagenome TaxID=1070528 RepID=A0A6C0HR74_9ZZZZ
MSLAMYASPYDSDEIEPKKIARAKTQKNVSEKVNDALQSMNEDTLSEFVDIKEDATLEEIKQHNHPRSITNYHKHLIPSNEIEKELPREKDILMEKINYIIGLLENQQDEKTNNIMEDLLIYTLLGCFIIFVIDKFVSVGKYVRD